MADHQSSLSLPRASTLVLSLSAYTLLNMAYVTGIHLAPVNISFDLNEALGLIPSL